MNGEIKIPPTKQIIDTTLTHGPSSACTKLRVNVFISIPTYANMSKSYEGWYMLKTFEYKFLIEDLDQASASRATTSLGDCLNEIDGVIEANRSKGDSATMDLGTIVTVIATSGATLAIAQGIAAWLKARRGVSLIIERNGTTGSMKATVAGLDPDAAIRITEIIRS
jgi:hypothetical protein